MNTDLIKEKFKTKTVNEEWRTAIKTIEAIEQLIRADTSVRKYTKCIEEIDYYNLNTTSIAFSFRSGKGKTVQMILSLLQAAGIKYVFHTKLTTISYITRMPEFPNKVNSLTAKCIIEVQYPKRFIN